MLPLLFLPFSLAWPMCYVWLLNKVHLAWEWSLKSSFASIRRERPLAWVLLVLLPLWLGLLFLWAVLIYVAFYCKSEICISGFGIVDFQTKSDPVRLLEKTWTLRANRCLNDKSANFQSNYSSWFNLRAPKNRQGESAPNAFSQRPLLSTNHLNESENDNYEVVFAPMQLSDKEVVHYVYSAVMSCVFYVCELQQHKSWLSFQLGIQTWMTVALHFFMSKVVCFKALSALEHTIYKSHVFGCF